MNPPLKPQLQKSVNAGPRHSQKKWEKEKKKGGGALRAEPKPQPRIEMFK
jgi:hypothetical protein